jgi:hypothetical protein
MIYWVFPGWTPFPLLKNENKWHKSYSYIPHTNSDFEEVCYKRGMVHINDEVRMTNGMVGALLENSAALVASHVLRLIPLGAGHSRAPAGRPLRREITKMCRGKRLQIRGR